MISDLYDIYSERFDDLQEVLQRIIQPFYTYTMMIPKQKIINPKIFIRYKIVKIFSSGKPIKNYDLWDQ